MIEQMLLSKPWYVWNDPTARLDEVENYLRALINERQR